jgi:hypothetical protein
MALEDHRPQRAVRYDKLRERFTNGSPGDIAAIVPTP